MYSLGIPLGLLGVSLVRFRDPRELLQFMGVTANLFFFVPMGFSGITMIYGDSRDSTAALWGLHGAILIYRHICGDSLNIPWILFGFLRA